MTTDKNILEALVSPMPVDEFLKKHWPDQHFIQHGSIDRLPQIFTTPILSSFQSLASLYNGRVLFGKGTQEPRSLMMQGVDARHLYSMGLSLYMPDIEPIVPGASEFLRQLEKELGLIEGDARFTAWASPSKDGIASHFDASEVFSIQLQGIKRFYVAPEKALLSPYGMQYGPKTLPFSDLYPQARNGFPKPDNTEFIEIEMKPGSVLFMPRGVWHRTEADLDSLSVTIVLSPVSAAECLLRELRLMLLQDPAWRRPIYSLADNEYRKNVDQPSVEELMQKLPIVINRLQAKDLTPRSVADRLANIDLNTRFQKIPYAHLEIESTDGTFLLRVCTWMPDIGQQVTMEMKVLPEYLPVLDWLENNEAAFSAKELSENFESISFGVHSTMLQYLTEANFIALLCFKLLE